MRKIFLFFIATLFSVSMWADADTWTVAGDNATLFGTTWAPSNTANDMTLKDGLYTWSVTDVELSAGFKFKVCQNHSWDVAYPAENYEVAITYKASYNITITFDSNTKNIDVDATPNLITLYFIDIDNWSEVAAYAYNSDSDKKANWPGDLMTPAGTVGTHNMYSYSFPDIYKNIIFNNNNGGKQTPSSTEAWNADKPYYYGGEWFENTSAIPDFWIAGSMLPAGDWWTNKLAVSGTSHTFTSLAAGEYSMKVILPSNTGAVWKGYSDLSQDSKDNPGLSADGDNNISFRLTEAADVTVTYTGSEFNVTTTGEFFHLDEGYYLVGTFSGVEKWLVTDLTSDKKFIENKYLGDNKREYKINTTVAEGDGFKAAYVYHNNISELVPAEGGNYIIPASQAGNVTIYFRVDYSGTDWGCNFYVEKVATAIDNTDASTKAVKRIVNGQLVIEREGKLFNALGAEVK